MSLAEKVRLKREEKRLTQAELARRAGLTQATISRVEHGEVKQLKSEAIKKLAKALGVSVDFLVGDLPKMSFEETVTADQLARVVFRGYENLTEERRRQLRDFVEFLTREQKKEEKAQAKGNGDSE